MHDPMTVAFDIKSPFKKKSELFPEGWRNTLITIWHVDPCKGPGGDDSCGWFKRPHHGNQEHYEKIKKEFSHDWDHNSKYEDGRPMFLGWFHPCGDPLYSPFAIALHFFYRTALIHFEGNFEKARKFVAKHHYDIVHFAENPHDSMIGTIQNKYNETREYRINSMAAMVYGCVLRWDQKWWQHPRWHVHHWKIQVHFVGNFKRWAFSRCCKCGKRFKWGTSVATNSWHGTGPLWFRSEKNVYHHNCLGAAVPESENKVNSQ